MAKFCGNCGSSVDDDAKVCGMCGAPIEADTSVDPGNMGGPIQRKPIDTKKLTAILVAAGAALLLIIAAIVTVVIISSNSGYNGLIKKTMSAYKNYDIDALVDMSSDVYFYDDDSDILESRYEYVVGNAIDKFESRVGHDYRLTYTVDEKYDYTARNFDKLIDSISNSYEDFDTDTIQAAAAADVSITATQGKKTLTQKITIVMTKEEGKWKLFSISAN